MIIQYTVLNCSSFIIHHSYSPLALFYSYNLVHARCWTGLNQTKSLTLEDHIIVSIKSIYEIYEMSGTRSATHDKSSNLWYQCNGAVLLMISRLEYCTGCRSGNARDWLVHAFKNQWVLSMCTCSLAISIVEIYYMGMCLLQETNT